MKYLDNYRTWIKQEYIDFLLSNNGTPRPNGGKNPDCEEFRIAPTVGYDMSATWWYFYDPSDFPFELTPPFEGNRKWIWWFIKMLPGNYMPMHRDPHVYADDRIKDCKRYWMPLQDYQDGHVFIYDNKMITDYHAGDLYAYDDANAIHGACNIGYTPRLTFLFTTFD